MYLLIVMLPLLGTITAGFAGFKIGDAGAARVTISCIATTFFLSCFAFYEVALAGSPCYIELFNWFNSGVFQFKWGFLFDTLTVTMLVVVTSISMFVHIYSTEYMKGDPHLARFMSYLSFFTFFMIILVTADNFLQMFLGWEGVGLCSYLLINFWFGRIQANKAALKAMFINRIGDFGLALGIFIIFLVCGSIEYTTVFACAPKFLNTSVWIVGLEFDSLTIVCFLFFIGAVGKSAQIGLHSWLPDAMEGPTPVSALIHAATMVTAGVFLIARCSPLFQYAPFTCILVTGLGAITAFVAATTGLLQNDLKRVIAYSTCSQLGYMIFACGISGYSMSIFHLANHAFFKALLFLSAGSVIHALSDEQDMRRMGGLLKILPFTYSMIVIGSLALMGFPFLAGFYSKDAILELAYGSFANIGHFAYWLGCASAFATAFYSIRLIFLTFLKPTNAYKHVISHAHEGTFVLTFPLFVLSIGSIFIGYITRDMMIGLGSDFWGNSLFLLPQNAYIFEAEWINTIYKIIPLILSLSGAFSAIIFYNWGSSYLFELKTSNIGLKLYNFLNRKWFYDKVYNEIISQNLLSLAYKHVYQNMDRGILELLGPSGISTTLYAKSSKINNLKIEFIFHYIFTFIISFFLILIFLGGWFFFSIYIDLHVLVVLFLFILLFI